MKNFIVLFVLCLCITVPDITAQKFTPANTKNNPTAERIARKAVSKLKKKAYKARFAFVYYTAETESTIVNKGDITIDNLLFRVEMNGIETKYDGLTQWVYMAANNEVTISEPGRDELFESNPMMMIEHYMERHRINMSTDQEDGFDVINFFPYDPNNSDFFKITFKISQNTGLPQKMTMWQRNGDRLSLEWDMFDEVEVDRSFFTFDVSRYPGVQVNDMR